jgi:hypothetical protein
MINEYRFSSLSKLVLLALAALLCGVVLSACSEVSPKKDPKPRIKPDEKVQDLGETVVFNPSVDILFVIDDSGSMSGHQRNLSRNVDLFVNELQNNQILDYHIGVITSTVGGWNPRTTGDGRLFGNPRYVERSTPNGLQALRSNLVVGTDGAADERFFEPTVMALSAPLNTTWNAGFYRPDAHLAIIFITDTDDQSRGWDAPTFHSFLVSLKSGDKDKVLPYAVFIPVADRVCSRSGEEPPQKIEAFMRLSGGISFGLCDPDYGQKLAGIGKILVERIGKTVYLTRPPQVHTIEVRFGTQLIPNEAKTGWTYDPEKNALILGDEITWSTQPPGTRLAVTFLAAEFPESEAK